MAKIVQATFSQGYGGLEMVLIEFHEWLIQIDHEAYVICLENSPLHRSLIAKGFEKSTIAIKNNWFRFFKGRAVRKALDNSATAFLFHRHSALRVFWSSSSKAKVTLLSHTFCKAKKRDPFHRFIFSKVDQWIALTNLHKANLVETTGVNPEKICVIPNGVDLKKFNPQKRMTSSKDFHIGVVARIDQQKGQDLAIHAVSLLKKHGYSIRLHFFGEPTPGEWPSTNKLKKLSLDLGMTDEIIFEGFKPKIEKEMINLDLLWLPSHRETFGRCLIEAMACGIPIVASNSGGVPDVIRHNENGLLFNTKDPHDLFSKTRTLIDNLDLRNTLAQSALAEVKKKYEQEKIWLELQRVILPNK